MTCSVKLGIGTRAMAHHLSYHLAYHLIRPLLRKSALIGAAFFAVGISAPVFALPVHYSETSSGDLVSVPATDLIFDIGTNVVSGNTHFGVNLPGHTHFDSDFDGFAFTLLPGMRLSHIGLTFSTTFDNASKANSELRLCKGMGDCDLDPMTLLGTETVDYLGSTPAPIGFGFMFPIEAGCYSIVPHSLGIAALDPTDSEEAWWTDYSWTFDVVSVPEPKASGLLALGLLVLVGRVRKPHRRLRQVRPTLPR